MQTFTNHKKCAIIYSHINNKIIGGNMWDPTSQFQKTVLPNGLRIYVAQMENREIESVKFLVHSGSLRDSRSALGTAHFLEHLISENIDLGRLLDLFDKDGGTYNLGQTDRMNTEFSFVSTSENFETFFEVFAQMLMEERDFSKGIEKERKIIKREFLRDYPFKQIYEIAQKRMKALYDESHILSEVYSTLGTLDSIASITSEDIRKFHKLYYTPSNISIIAVGGLSVESVLSIVKKSPFAEIKDWGVEYENIPVITAMREPTEHYSVLKYSDFSSLKVNSICFSCMVVIPATVDVFVPQIFKRMLARRLRREIRERHSWAYVISYPLRKTDYSYEFEVECRELSVDAKDKIGPVVNRCIGEIRGDLDGFERICKSFIAEYKFIDLNVLDTRNTAADRLFDYGDLISTEEIIQRINNITFSQIQEFCDMMSEQYRHYRIILP